MAWLAYIPPGGRPDIPITAAVLVALAIVLAWPLVLFGAHVLALVPARVRAWALGIGAMSALAYIGPGDSARILVVAFVLLAAALFARLVGHACSRVGESLFDVGHPVPALQRPWRAR